MLRNQINQELLYPKSAADAVAIQKNLREEIVLQNGFSDIKIIAGIDSGYDPTRNLIRASIILLKYPQLEVVEEFCEDSVVEFPYIPGLLSFREIPAIIEVLKKLKYTPDLLMVDGHGIAHPRRMGIAAHLGVITNMPSIGVAKKRLTGQFTQPHYAKFSESNLYYKNEMVGVVLQSKERTKPIFISPGNMIDIRTSVKIVKSCIIRHKLPEPTRLADKFSKFTN